MNLRPPAPKAREKMFPNRIVDTFLFLFGYIFGYVLLFEYCFGSGLGLFCPPEHFNNSLVIIRDAVGIHGIRDGRITVS